MNKCVDLIGLSIGNSVIVNEMNEVQRMKKRILSAALALCMMFGSAAALPQGIFSSETSITASAITSGDYTYTELSDGTAQITRYIGSSTSITIPSTIDGKTVTSIKRVASTLKANTTLASITIPSSVKTVEEGAFRYCQALTSVTFKGDIESIGSAAFDGCIKLTTMKLPNGIKTLPANLFCGCTSLTSVNIPASVTSVSSKVFGSPDNESLGDLCTKLQTITVDSGNSSFSSVDGVLYNKAKTAIIWCPYDKTSLNIPGTVKSIPADTIYCKATSITLNSGTQSIAAQALVFCPQLKTITIPASVTNLGSQSVGYTKASMFDEATKIQSFTIRGYTGSAAETYAKENNFTFVSIGTSCTHSYTASSWAWTGYTAAKVTLKCSKCGDTRTVDATVTPTTKDATCTATGTKTYTATATVGSQNFKDQKTETIAAKGHSYSTTPTWSWNGTASATASFKCIRCTDAKTVNATITSKTTPATTTADGKTVYTATATYNGKNYTDTKTVTIPKLNCTHSYAVSSWTWSGYTSAKANLKCSKCGDTRTVDATTITPSITKAATCTTAGVRTYAATVTFNSKNYYDTKTETIAATGHSWGTPTWSWSGTTSATATFKCSKCGATQTAKATIASSVTKAATCTTAGVRTYTATAVFNSKNYYATKTETIAAKGHSWGTPTWSWNGTTSATATFKCSKCGATQSVSAKITSAETTPATCTTAGVKTYTATVTFNSKNYYDTKTETINPTGHSYSTTPTWSWSGTTSATATFKCSKCGATQTAKATIASSVTKAATCTTAGVKTYTATAVFNSKNYYATKTEAIAATGHSWGTPTWSWNGTTSATATFKCSKCGATQSVSAKITSAETTPATCTTAGVKTYTATATFNSKNYTAAKTGTIAATGHNYVAKTIAPTCTAQGYTEHTCSKCHSSYNDNYKNATGHTFGEDPEWKWAADYSSATATFKCTKGDHVETISASISKTVKAATCAAEGSTTYNASVSFGGKTYTNAKAVPIPATGKHNYVTKTYAPTCKAEGYTEHKCSVCGHTYKTDVKSKVDHKWGSWKVIKAATETSTGTQEHTCTVCGAKETATIPKTTHKHSYTTKVVAPTCTDQGYTLHTCSCGYSYKDTYKNATGHSYTTKVTAPTCTAKGYTTHTCTKCKTSYKDTYTNPTGHKWNSGTITTQPTVIKTGVKTYTCTACKKTKTEAVNKLSLRLFGKSRYETSMAIATQLKKENGNKAFTSVIIASGTSNADALSAAYLAKVKNAPILITAPSETTTIVNYIKANAASTAKIYIVGGTGAVNADTEKKLKAIYKTTNQVVRLGGKTRFETNLLVLKEAKVSNQEILVASGMDYPDALSASAVGLPILLVSGNSLTAEQQTYLKSLKSTKITIVGGNGAVSAGVESSIKALKKFAAPTRLGGSNRYETSLMVANKYFASAPTMAVAYGLNFPDGLCGGPLAMKYKCPLLLATSKDTTSAHTYAYTHKETNTVTFGGTALVSDSAVKAIVG